MLDGALQLSLICAVSFSVTDSSTTSLNPGYGGAPVYAESTRRNQLEGELRFEFSENSRMRLPHQLGGSRDDGWRELKNVSVVDEKITARFSLEFAVGGQVEIDRMTGDVRVRYGNLLWGDGQIVGRCDRYEAPVERRF